MCVLTVSVKVVLELSDGRRDLQSEVEDLLLALEADVLGPSDHTREVAGGLDILADTEVTRALLDEGVLCKVRSCDARRTSVRNFE
jgi:hypothetical protein